MKKFLSALLICIMIASTLAGCGTSVDGTPGSSSTKPSNKPTPTPTMTPYKSNPLLPSPSKMTIQYSADDWIYAIEKNVMTVYGYRGTEKFVTIPETINHNGVDYDVRILDTNALCNTSRIYVGDSHYICDLEEVIIPDCIEEIPVGLFEHCDDLTKLQWKGFKIVNNVVFSKDMTILYYCLNKDITSYEIPSTVKTIAGGAFRSCTQLTKIDIPSTVETVQNYAFYGCTLLKSVNIKNGVKTLGSQLFTLCTHLESLMIPESIIACGDQLCTFNPRLEIYIKEGSMIDEFFKDIDETREPLTDEVTYVDYVKYID